MTPTQWLVLALVLVAGWLFGLASHPGGRKWRDRYTTERDAHAAYRADADARVAEADRRATEAVAERDRLASAAPAARKMGPDAGATVATPVPPARVEPIAPISSTTFSPTRRDA